MGCVAVVPARKGSKRLPGKNMLPVGGRPMIYWSIRAALESRCVERVVVSSDDEAVLELATSLGAVALRRPERLATDESTTADVVCHALESLDRLPSHVCLLQPTSPLRGAEHVDEAWAVMVRKGAKSVISVSLVDHPPQWSNRLPEDGSLCDFLPAHLQGVRSQDLPPYYRLNGAIYLAESASFLAQKSFFLKPSCYAYVMEAEASVDVDNRIDWLLADLLMQEKRKKDG